MRAPITVIIPTLNAEQSLPASLAALAEGLSEGLIRDLIISDGGSTDTTHFIAQAAGADLVVGPPSRGGQLRRGAQVAQGEWLLILHADTVLQPGWTTAVAGTLGQPGAYFGQLRFDTTGIAARIVAGWANTRARRLGLPYGDQALLIDRATYRTSGGFPDIPLMEDVALARLLRGHLKPLDMVAETSAAKYRQQGWLRRGGRNLLTLCRYLLGADPETLARDYGR